MAVYANPIQLIQHEFVPGMNSKDWNLFNRAKSLCGVDLNTLAQEIRHDFVYQHERLDYSTN
jgi:hypothetical protein